MSYMQIPLDNTPNCSRSFKITLDGGSRNANITLRLRYLDLKNYWIADIVDAKTNEDLVCGIPCVPNTNLLEQHQYLDLGNAYILNAEPTELENPDNTTLGTTFVLLWGDDS